MKQKSLMVLLDLPWLWALKSVGVLVWINDKHLTLQSNLDWINNKHMTPFRTKKQEHIITKQSRCYFVILIRNRIPITIKFQDSSGGF